jgi:hypothetical protein
MARNPILVTNGNRIRTLHAQRQLIDKLPTAFPAGARIPINGKLMAVLDIVAMLEGSVAAFVRIAQLKAELHAAVVDAATALKAVRAVVHDLRDYAIVTFGRGHNQLSQLGFSPPKQAKRSPAVKAVAAVKGKATRVARGTKGKNQRKAIRAAAR